jgi:large subunit ribosomal protein L32
VLYSRAFLGGNQVQTGKTVSATALQVGAAAVSFAAEFAPVSAPAPARVTQLSADTTQHHARAPGLSGAEPDQEISMAVQQNKKSPSKRGMHRSHNALVTPGTAIEPTTGEVHLRHHISPTGFYRGRKVLKSKADA